MVIAIVLAAGTSSRMGSPKQLLNYQGRPLLRHVIDNLTKSKINNIIVVLGHRFTEVAATLEGLPLQLVNNQDYTSGQSSSLKAGLKAILSPGSYPISGSSPKGVLFVLGDQPLLKPETVDLLIEKFNLHGGIIAPYFQDTRGNPVIFDLSFSHELDNLQGDAGAREIIARHPEALHKIEVNDQGILLDVDTPEDWNRLSDL